MRQVEKIIFDSKYSLKYMNDIYVLSGFNHICNIHIEEEDIYHILNDEKLVYFSQEDWEEFVKKYKGNK